VRTPGWTSALAAWARDDRGSISVVGYAIAFTAVMALLTLLLQAAVYFAARDAADAAASEGVDAARVQGGSLDAGESAACAYAAAVAGGFLRSTACTGSSGPTITITVCGDALTLLAGLPRICEQAQGARERFTTP
jgi:uncharacterized membrane protein